jgi:uncharacterized protein involved in exopolysaccharide biosynthesis
MGATFVLIEHFATLQGGQRRAMTNLPLPQMDPPPLREFLAHAYLRRAPAAVIFACVLGTFILVAALLPTRYKAEASLAVLPAPEFTVRPDAGSNNFNASALAMDQIMKAETDILASDDLHAEVLRKVAIRTIYAALADPGDPGFVHTWLRPLATPWLGPARTGQDAMIERALLRFDSDLDVRPSKEGNVIGISFKADDGPTAALVANTLLSTYAARRTRLYDDPQLRVVTQEAEAVRRASVHAGSRLAAFKAAHAISNYDEERSHLLRRRSDTLQAKADVDMAAAAQQALMDELDRQIAAQPSSKDMFREHDSDTRLQAIDGTLIDLRNRLSVARVHYLDSSRMVTDLNGQIAAREGERQRLSADPSPSVSRAGPNPAREALMLDRARAISELAAARSRAKSQQHVLADIDAALAATDTQEQALDELVRQKKVADDNFTAASRVMAERRLTEAEDSLRLANVRVIEPARTPLKPEPLKLLLVLAGSMLGLVGASAYLVASFAARPTFLTAAGLAQATGLPVLGVFREAEFAV